MNNEYVISLDQLSMNDIAIAGGKNASLGEMLQHLTKAGVKVPGGYAIKANAYQEFLAQDGLDERIYHKLQALDVDDVVALKKSGAKIRQWINQADFNSALIQSITDAYQTLGDNVSVALRSSATAEDLPTASFAGQQASFLHIRGIERVLESVKQVYMSLFTDRAIAYRIHHGFAHEKIAISVAMQRMVQSDNGVSGVMFTLDTESGFDKVVLITASYGLGEAIVSGSVNPDEFYVHKTLLQQQHFPILRRTLGSKHHKIMFDETTGRLQKVHINEDQQGLFSLQDEDVIYLAKQAILIEQHYGCAMDIEWAKDSEDGQIYMLQARPETVEQHRKMNVVIRYELIGTGKVVAAGRSVGSAIGQGVARVVQSAQDMQQVQAGEVLVTDMTDPDWEPIMRRASSIVTNRGGRTCHAAIVARELGIPAVVGCGDATEKINTGDEITVSCAEGETGMVYQGLLEFKKESIDIGVMPDIPVSICMNLGNPNKAFQYQFLPNHGVGLARLEFIISNMIGIHPGAVLHPDRCDEAVNVEIAKRAAAYASPRDFYIQKMCEGIATIAAAFYPKKVVLRFSDFKSNEYANLLGGEFFEPIEENPMLGYRGTGRYISEQFKDCFQLECAAVKRVREDMGLNNLQVMLPFLRTLDEAKKITDILIESGLKRGEQGLKVLMMCEIPANALLADAFLEYFDGFSIGSNDLTQLTLGLDRDSDLVAAQFDERNQAVLVLLERAIRACRKANKSIGICGQGPSDYPDFAKWLVDQGIDSISLTPDAIVHTWLSLAKV